MSTRQQWVKITILSFILVMSEKNLLYATLAADYANEAWTCEQANSDKESYTSLDGVPHATNPLGHPEYLNANRACDFRAIFDYTGVPYGWGHWHTLQEFRNYITAGKGAGNHKIHGSAPSWSTGIDCSGLISRVWGLSSKHSTSMLENISYRVPGWDVDSNDILNEPGDHAKLIESGVVTGTYPNETITLAGYEASGGAGRVVSLSSDYANERQAGFTLRRKGTDNTAPTITNINISPNPFSPNGDGIDDISTSTFTITDTQCGAVSLKLYINNQHVHTFPNTCLDGVKLPKSGSQYTKEFSWAWDGKINGTLQPSGSYPLKIEVKDLNGNVNTDILHRGWRVSIPFGVELQKVRFAKIDRAINNRQTVENSYVS